MSKKVFKGWTFENVNIDRLFFWSGVPFMDKMSDDYLRSGIARYRKTVPRALKPKRVTVTIEVEE